MNLYCLFMISIWVVFMKYEQLAKLSREGKSLETRLLGYFSKVADITNFTDSIKFQTNSIAMRS